MRRDVNDLEYMILEKKNAVKLNADTSTKLLSAAATIFSKYGYEGSSLRQISDLAGVKHGSVKYHFQNKKVLWEETVAFLYSLLIEATKADEDIDESNLSPEDFLAHMKAMTRIYIRFSAKYPELFRILTFETMHQSERLDWIVENFSKPFAKKSMNRINQAKAAGIYPKHLENLNIYYISLAAARTIFLLAPEVKRTFGTDVFEAEALKRHEDAVVELLFR